MSKAFVGRAIALVGIMCGLLALGLPIFPGFRYTDDGTVFAFLLVLLAFASLFPSEAGRDLQVAAGGAAAFGFFLLLPATAAFDRFGVLDSGAWLGLCTVLIPLGLLTASWSEERPAHSRQDLRRGAGLPVCTLALALLVAGIWLDANSAGQSYWNLSSSGHAVGIVMLVLVALNVVLLGGPAHLAMPDLGDLDVLVAATTFGFVEVGLVSTAFEDFGSLGAGGWLEACAGVMLIVGVSMMRSGAHSSAAAPEAVPAAATAG